MFNRRIAQDKHLIDRNLLLFFAPRTYFPELGHNPAPGDGHYYGLHSAQFIIGDAFFSGHARVMFHSGIAADGHGRGHVDHERGFRFQNVVVACRAVKSIEGFFLFFRQQS